MLLQSFDISHIEKKHHTRSQTRTADQQPSKHSRNRAVPLLASNDTQNPSRQGYTQMKKNNTT